jgi:proline iminopeptidase
MESDDGCRLWTAQTGHGATMIMCHGGPGLWDYLEPLAEAFREQARTIRWDQRGCGRSERRGPCTMARFVADLDAVRRHAGVERVDLLGHSWGATLALRYALDHPDRVRRLIYVSGTGIDPDETWKPIYHQGTEERLRGPATGDERELAIRQWSTDFVDPATARQHAERMATPWYGINRECAGRLNAENRRYLRETDLAARCRALTVPVLIIDGDQDTRPRWAVDSLERALRNVHRVTLTGAGHLPWVEDRPGFCAAVWEAGARPPRQEGKPTPR